MVLEIWSMTNKIFCYFRQFFAILPPLTTWKIKILKNWKKTPGDIIILHMCSISKNHVMFDSWDMEHEKQNFLSFWAISALLPPPPPKTPKNQYLKESFYTSVPKIMIICYTVPEIWHKTYVIVIFHFGLYFALLPS